MRKVKHPETVITSASAEVGRAEARRLATAAALACVVIAGLCLLAAALGAGSEF